MFYFHSILPWFLQLLGKQRFGPWGNLPAESGSGCDPGLYHFVSEWWLPLCRSYVSRLLCNKNYCLCVQYGRPQTPTQEPLCNHSHHPINTNRFFFLKYVFSEISGMDLIYHKCYFKYRQAGKKLFKKSNSLTSFNSNDTYILKRF